MSPFEQRDREKMESQKLVYQGRNLSLMLRTYSTGKAFEIVKRSEAVVILPILADQKILLIQQWRRPIDEIIFELPAGVIEEGEEPIACANRELQEETGFAAKSLKPLGGFYTAPGYSDEYLHLFVATDLYKSPLTPDDDEVIQAAHFSFDEAKQLILTNQIRDAKSISGILKYLI